MHSEIHIADFVFVLFEESFDTADKAMEVLLLTSVFEHILKFLEVLGLLKSSSMRNGVRKDFQET